MHFQHRWARLLPLLHHNQSCKLKIILKLFRLLVEPFKNGKFRKDGHKSGCDLSQAALVFRDRPSSGSHFAPGPQQALKLLTFVSFLQKSLFSKKSKNTLLVRCCREPVSMLLLSFRYLCRSPSCPPPEALSQDKCSISKQ